MSYLITIADIQFP